MSKLKLVDSHGETVSKVLPKPKDAKPVGMQILVELLTPQEALGTSVVVGSDAKVGAPQGFIKAIGPKVDKEWGIAVGDRVILTGNFTPLPELDTNNDRHVACVEPHVIKAVLVS